MLYSISTQAEIKSIPRNRAADFRAWRSRLTDTEDEAILGELHSRIEGTEVQTSSWIPGANWSGTVFHPIWEKPCLKDVNAAAKFFGLIVWDAFLRHPDWWGFGRYELDGVPIQGLTYFKIAPPT